MADKLNFSLVSPAAELFSGEVDHVVAPGTDGDFGVLPSHAPFMSTLKNGAVRILDANSNVTMQVFVRGGFADVTPEGLTVLAEEAVDLAKVDAGELAERIEATKNTTLAEPDNLLAQEDLTYLQALQAALSA